MNQERKITNPERQLIFVYGTLKRGLSNHSRLAGQKFVSEARTQPMYRLIDLGGYPGMMRATNDGLAIEGEVWETDENCMHALDRLEDVEGGEYERTIIALAAPFENQQTDGYLYLRSATGRRDVGSVW